MKQLCFVIAIVTGTAAQAQSPAQSSVTIEGKTIAVTYAAPPSETQTFRGAAFHTDADLVFKGATVPKGDYTLYLVPADGTWQLAINKQKQAGPHNPKLDIGRVPMTVAKAGAPAASKVALVKTAARAAKVEVTWADSVGFAQFHLNRVGGDSEW